MKHAILLPALLFAGCGGAGDRSVAALQPDDRIECRPAGEAAFARTCTLETFDSADGRLLTVRKADGGFRRLRVVPDGQGIVAADGAEPARVTVLDGGRIEVEVGGDRFRLPAQ